MSLQVLPGIGLQAERYLDLKYPDLPLEFCWRWLGIFSVEGVIEQFHATALVGTRGLDGFRWRTSCGDGAAIRACFLAEVCLADECFPKVTGMAPAMLTRLILGATRLHQLVYRHLDRLSMWSYQSMIAKTAESRMNAALETGR